MNFGEISKRILIINQRITYYESLINSYKKEINDLNEVKQNGNPEKH